MNVLKNNTGLLLGISIIENFLRISRICIVSRNILLANRK